MGKPDAGARGLAFLGSKRVANASRFAKHATSRATRGPAGDPGAAADRRPAADRGARPAAVSDADAATDAAAAAVAAGADASATDDADAGETDDADAVQANDAGTLDSGNSAASTLRTTGAGRVGPLSSVRASQTTPPQEGPVSTRLLPGVPGPDRIPHLE